MSQLSWAETQVAWRNGTPFPEGMSPGAIREAAADWKAQHAEGGLSNRHGLVRFRQPPNEDSREALAEAGLRLLTPLGGSAFFAGGGKGSGVFDCVKQQ